MSTLNSYLLCISGVATLELSYPYEVCIWLGKIYVHKVRDLLCPHILSGKVLYRQQWHEKLRTDLKWFRDAKKKVGVELWEGGGGGSWGGMAGGGCRLL